ncbi:mandelate racemase/muconate lactonizing enzyme family protein [Amycolatopsis sp. NPDC051903]|uniref:mandelate racemase/muconate lactonizing enzyme family protein n=1 Tax=Amycolatopsis sp. NPDC051903 TaxID=3363936 RepID=UPI0037A95BE7
MKIERVDIVVTELAGRVRRTMSSGGYDTGPAGTPMGKPVLVRIHAEGVVGYGQVRPTAPGHFVPDTVHSVIAAIREIYGPYLIGKDVFDIARTWDDFDRILPFNSNARAAVDFALHDAMGKAAGLPVHKLIGGACQSRIPLEWSISLADDVRTMIDDAERAVHEFGIKVLCLKAGGRGGWRADVANFAAVRAAVGPDVVIGVDPNTGWLVSETIKAMSALAEYDLGYVEQPVGRRDMAGLARVRAAAAGVPVMADESLFTVQDAHDLAKAEAVDVLCVKLYKTGGIHQAKRIAAIAEAASMRINIGGLAVQSQLEAAAGAHYCASLPERHVMPGAEFIFGLGVAGADPLVADSGFVIQDGHVDVPTGPGLGITIDEDAVAARTILSESVSRS